MKYSHQQLARLRYLLSDAWVTEDANQATSNFLQALALIESPFELHQFAANFNWDCGHEELSHVIEHPFCDQGTALMIYHLGHPGFFYSQLREMKQLIGDQPAVFQFLRDIEAKFQRGGFAYHVIPFDPLNASGRNFLKAKGAELLPEIMKRPIIGTEVEILNLQ